MPGLVFFALSAVSITALCSWCTLVWLRRRRARRLFELRRLLGRTALAIAAVPGGVIPADLLALLLQRLTHLVAADGHELGASALALLQRLADEHRRATPVGALSVLKRQAALGGVSSLSEILASMGEGDAHARAIHWRCEAGLADLGSRLKADQLEHEALASHHLGDHLKARRCYLDAQRLVSARPQIARPRELLALASRIEPIPA